MENVLNPSNHSSGVSGIFASACLAITYAMFSNISRENVSSVDASSTFLPIAFSKADNPKLYGRGYAIGDMGHTDYVLVADDIVAVEEK
ncbi:MAG: hypothetical protein KHW68_05520 [Lachnospiraceae bacterium]|nr:hypothetical protein [Lachnospiraceae bacterium]